MRKLTVIIICIFLATTVYANSAEVGPKPADISAVAEIAVRYYTTFGRVPTNEELNMMIFHVNLGLLFSNPKARRVPYAFPHDTPIHTKTAKELSLEEEKGIWNLYNNVSEDGCAYLRETECDCDKCLARGAMIATVEAYVFSAALFREYLPGVEDIWPVIKRVRDFYSSSKEPKSKELPRQGGHNSKAPEDMGNFIIRKEQGSYGYNF